MPSGPKVINEISFHGSIFTHFLMSGTQSDPIDLTLPVAFTSTGTQWDPIDIEDETTPIGQLQQPVLSDHSVHGPNDPDAGVWMLTPEGWHLFPHLELLDQTPITALSETASIAGSLQPRRLSYEDEDIHSICNSTITLIEDYI